MAITLLLLLLSLSTHAFEIRFEIKDFKRLESISKTSFCTPVRIRQVLYPYFETSCELSAFQMNEIQQSIHHSTNLTSAYSILLNTHRFIPRLKQTLESLVFKDLLGRIRAGLTLLSYARDFEVLFYPEDMDHEISAESFKLTHSFYQYHDFRFFDFKNKIVQKTKISKSFFYKADFSSADLREIEFVDCDLRGAYFNHRTKLPFSYEEAILKGMTPL